MKININGIEYKIEGIIYFLRYVKTWYSKYITAQGDMAQVFNEFSRFNFKLFADPTDEEFVFEDKLLCLLGLFFTEIFPVPFKILCNGLK